MCAPRSATIEAHLDPPEHGSILLLADGSALVTGRRPGAARAGTASAGHRCDQTAQVREAREGTILRTGGEPRPGLRGRGDRRPGRHRRRVLGAVVPARYHARTVVRADDAD